LVLITFFRPFNFDPSPVKIKFCFILSACKKFISLKILFRISSNLAEMISLTNLDEIFLNLVSEKYLSDKNPSLSNSSSKLLIIDMSLLINSYSIFDK